MNGKNELANVVSGGLDFSKVPAGKFVSKVSDMELKLMGIDPLSASFSYRNVPAYAPRYFNRADINSAKGELGGWPIWEPDRVEFQIIDQEFSPYPADANQERFVMYFKGCPTGIVLNATRCAQLTAICRGKSHPAYWACIPALQVSVEEINDKIQISLTYDSAFKTSEELEAMPTVDELNEVLFNN